MKRIKYGLMLYFVLTFAHSTTLYAADIQVEKLDAKGTQEITIMK